MGDYGSNYFDHWLDNGSTLEPRSISVSTNTELIAVYRNTATPTASISLNPTSGQVGTSVTITGVNFLANSAITIRYDGNIVSTTPSTTTSNTAGGFSTSFSVPSSTSGTHPVSATDGTRTATSTFTVTTPTLSSSTTISSATNPSVTGQPVTFSAAVTGSGGTPTGTVTFYDGSTVIGTGTLSGGTATLTVSSLSVGNHSITASYGGNSQYNSSTSNSVAQTVNKGNTSTVITSNVNPSSVGQSITLIATVSPVVPATGTRTGTVTFFDGPTSIGTGTLSGSVATLTISTLGAGSHGITASYGGDANFNTSASSTLTQTIKAATLTSLVSSVNPSLSGQSVTFTATVTSAAGTPTGTVAFLDGSTTIGTGTLAGSIAIFSTSSLSGGTHSITATYTGDANYNSSTSTALSQTVTSSGSYPITHMQDTTVSFATLVSSQRQIIGEFVTPTSQLVGDKIDKITLQLQKIRSPVGIAQIGIFNSDLTAKRIIGTMDASTISTSLTNYDFILPSTEPLYTIQSGDIIGIKFTGSYSQGGINLTVDRTGSDPFDGQNSHRVRYESSWITTQSNDMYMILQQTHG
jgi:hypothetical protein